VINMIKKLFGCDFKAFELAANVIELLMTKDARNQKALQSALGRLMLMLGDVSAAEAYFATCDQADTRSIVDRGLVAITQNAFQEAFDIFSKALVTEPNNVLVKEKNCKYFFH